MPVEFLHETGDNSKDYKLLMAYDGSGRRISKTRYSKNVQYGYWTRDVVTHYTGIGTEVREAMRRSASPKTTVVVNLPQGLGRYMPEDAEKAAGTAIPLDKDGKPVYVGEMTPEFEWYLKNHLGSTMLVYGTQPYNDKYSSYAGGVKAAYDYRAFGEQVSLAEPTDKVTENFTGKEKDDETELNYFGARYLDPMLGLWISVDPKRQFTSPYLYVGNGMNPVNGVDDDGEYMVRKLGGTYEVKTVSKADARMGFVAKDLLPVFIPGLGGLIHSFVKGTIEDKLSQTVQKTAITEGSGKLVELENKSVGKFVGKALSLFDLKLSYDEAMKRVDAPENVEKFENSLKSNGGEHFNSFKTEEEARAYAESFDLKPE